MAVSGKKNTSYVVARLNISITVTMAPPSRSRCIGFAREIVALQDRVRLPEISPYLVMMLLYERVVATLLRESKIDTFARKLTQKVINVAKKKGADLAATTGRGVYTIKIPWPEVLKRKDGFGSIGGRIARSQVTRENPYAPHELKVKLTIQLIRSEREEIAMDASWSPLTDEMNVRLIVFTSTGLQSKDYTTIQQKAYEAIRHELEHSTQSLDDLADASDAGQGMMTSPRAAWRDAGTLGAYLLSQAELEAWTAGMYHRAKRTRTPFIKVIDDQVEQLMRQTTKAGGDAVEMRNILMQVRWKWIEYAKKRFPKAILTP